MRLSRLLKANEFSIYLQNSERKSYTNPTGNMHIQCKQGGNQNCALRHNSCRGPGSQIKVLPDKQEHDRRISNNKRAAGLNKSPELNEYH